MDRREFLRAAGLSVAAASLGPQLSSLFGGTTAEAEAIRGFTTGSILDAPASEAPIDTIVVLMMENRSFDHYLGWLGDDASTSRTAGAASRTLPGRRRPDPQRYSRPDGTRGRHVPPPGRTPARTNPYRGCGHPDPGHGWNAGRAQRDGGFLAEGSGNDEFALGYFRAERPARSTPTVTRRFTVVRPLPLLAARADVPEPRVPALGAVGRDQGQLLPVRGRYRRLHVADDLGPARRGRRPGRYYFVDLPVTALWGPRLVPDHQPHRALLRRRRGRHAAERHVPRPGLHDRPAHRRASATATSAPARSSSSTYVKAFVESPHWERGALLPHLRRVGRLLRSRRGRRSSPTTAPAATTRRTSARPASACRRRMLSPYARRDFVDHTAVRPHLDPALHRVALPRRAAGRAEGPRLVSDATRSQRPKHRSEPARRPSRSGVRARRRAAGPDHIGAVPGRGARRTSHTVGRTGRPEECVRGSAGRRVLRTRRLAHRSQASSRLASVGSAPTRGG